MFQFHCSGGRFAESYSPVAHRITAHRPVPWSCSTNRRVQGRNWPLSAQPKNQQQQAAQSAALKPTRFTAAGKPLTSPNGNGSGGAAWSSALASVDDGTAGAAVSIKFCVRYKTSWGQAVKVIGSHPSLGNWSVKSAFALQCQSGDVWSGTLTLPTNPGVLEYKYVMIDYYSQAPQAWQEGGNNVLAIRPGEHVVECQDNWPNSPGALVKTDNGSSTREDKLQSWAGEMMSYRIEARMARMESNELKAEAAVMKAEVQQLKSELQQSKAAHMMANLKNAELQQENMRLSGALVAVQDELCETMRVAINVLKGQGSDSEDVYEEGTADDYGTGGSSSSRSNTGGKAVGRNNA